MSSKICLGIVMRCIVPPPLKLYGLVKSRKLDGFVVLEFGNCWVLPADRALVIPGYTDTSEGCLQGIVNQQRVFQHLTLAENKLEDLNSLQRADHTWDRSDNSCLPA